jgi:MFS family permease
MGLFWGSGCILGPIIGGAFAVSNATWRWAFYINLVLAIVLIPIYILLLPDHNPQPLMSFTEKLGSIDWVGAVLNATVFCTFMTVLTFAGSWGWNAPGTIALWVVFGVALICFGFQATFNIFNTPERRLFPVQFLKRRTMILLYFVNATTGTGLAIPIYYVPLFFQFTKGDSAIQAAVRLLPFIAVCIGSMMFSGALLPTFGRYMLWYIPAGILMTVGGSLMFTVTPTTSAASIYGYEVLMAVGTGLASQIAYSVAAAKVKPYEVAAAMGFINVAQVGSIAIALSIAGAIFQNLGLTYLREALAGYNFSDAELSSALSGIQSAILSHSDPMVVGLAIGAVAHTISRLFALVIAAGALTLVSAAFMKRENLDLSPTTSG